LYISAPYSDVIGFAKIARLTEVDFREASNLHRESHVSDKELREYFEGYKIIGCYFIREIKLFNSPVALKELRDSWSFFPPQSFVSLSREAASWFESKKTFGSDTTNASSDAASLTGGRA
jgi:predicted transcriptional regulator